MGIFFLFFSQMFATFHISKVRRVIAYIKDNRNCPGLGGCVLFKVPN